MICSTVQVAAAVVLVVVIVIVVLVLVSCLGTLMNVAYFSGFLYGDVIGGLAPRASVNVVQYVLYFIIL